MGKDVFNSHLTDYYNAALDTVPFLAALRSAGTFQAMKRLANSPELGADKDLKLGALLFNSYVIDCFTDHIRGEAMPAGMNRNVVNQAFSAACTESVQAISVINSRLQGMDQADPRYGQYMELKNCLSLTMDAAERISEVATVRDVRLFKTDDPEMLAKENAYLEQNKEYFSHADDVDDYADMMEGIDMPLSDFELTQNRVFAGIVRSREELGAGNTEPVDKVLADFDAQYEAISATIPDSVQRLFDGVHGLADTSRRIDELMDESNRNFRELNTFKEGITTNLQNFLKDSGFSGLFPDAHAAAALSAAVMNIYESGADLNDPETAGRTAAELSGRVKELYPAFPESDKLAKALVDNCKENIAAYSRMKANETQAEALRPELLKVYERAGIEHNRMEYVETHKERIESFKARRVQDLTGYSATRYQNGLKDLELELSRAKKFGFNTSVFNNFSRALHAAANGGDAEALRSSAARYIAERSANGGPSSKVGKARLEIARRVLELTEGHLKMAKNPVIPEAEKDAPLEQVDLDIEFGEEAVGAPVEGGMPKGYPQDGMRFMPDEYTVMIPGGVDQPEPVFVHANAYSHAEPGNPTGEFIEVANSQMMDNRNIFYPIYTQRMLSDAFGKDEAWCIDVSERMMKIAERNITGNCMQDCQNAFTEFTKEFLASDPVFKAEGNKYANSMVFSGISNFIYEYDMSLQRTMTGEERMDGRSFTLDELKAKQLSLTVEGYRNMFRIFSADPYFTQRVGNADAYRDALISIASSPERTADERNFMRFLKEGTVKQMVLMSHSPEELSGTVQEFFGKYKQDQAAEKAEAQKGLGDLIKTNQQKKQGPAAGV